LKTLVAMPFAPHRKTGATMIEAQGVRHAITFTVDQLRQEPAIEYKPMPFVPEKSGTRITLFWPHSASSARSILVDAESRFLQIADDFGWINPHLWSGSNGTASSRSIEHHLTPLGKSGERASQLPPIGTI
jgi:hypothetical protein